MQLGNSEVKTKQTLVQVDQVLLCFSTTKEKKGFGVQVARALFLNALLEDYDSTVTPTFDKSQPTNVNVSVYINNIDAVNEQTMHYISYIVDELQEQCQRSLHATMQRRKISLHLKGSTMLKNDSSSDRRKLAYYGHIRRHCSIQKRVVEGKVEGKRGRGRKRQSWLANIQETSQLRLSVACEAALDRERWRRMTAHLGDGTAQR
ncbi:hypothetical protein EGW08_000774 [Elysia chlorotica]|uniref:Uncharacterized protein n=1 Tax=Elysia chlorotica TaxID=188477 RepID=A0A3S1I3C2_ELYCH|nr:hypothetical protein EGW08_000774 [Elysia chlorotica]